MKNKKIIGILVCILFFGAGILLNINISAGIFDTISIINKNKYCSFLYLDDPPEEEWNITFGGIDYDDGYSVQQTDDGGFIITGFSDSFGAGNWDALLIKTDSNGMEEWNYTFGGADYDRGYCVQQTDDSGYIIAGCTHSFGAGYFDVWLIKTDSNGIEEWNSTFGGVSEDWGYSVQQTNDSGYIIAGYTNSYGAGESDFWLVKTDSNGMEEWNSTFGGIDYDRGRSVQQTKDGGYIITGNTVSYDSDDTGCDVWLIKTDYYGVIEWHQIFGGSGTKNKFDIGYTVQQTDEGGYIIAGDTEIYQVTMADFLLIKTDSNGKQEWYKTFGGNYADRGRFVQQTKEGGYILTGWTSSYSITDPDIWLIKTDSSGTETWNLIFGLGENSGDWGYSVKQTNDNGYIIIGATMPEGWINMKLSNSNTFEGTNVWLIKVEGENLSPSAPTITGPNSGKIGQALTYIFNAADPEDDNVRFIIDWGDTTYDTTGFVESGTDKSVSHIWDADDTYTISARVEDTFGNIGPSATLTVTIPRNKVMQTSKLLNYLENYPKASQMIYKFIGFKIYSKLYFFYIGFLEK